MSRNLLHLRVQYRLDGLLVTLGTDDEMLFDVGGTNFLAVSIGRIERGKTELVCRAESHCALPAEFRPAFEALARDELPPDHLPLDEEWEASHFDFGWKYGPDDALLMWGLLPPALKAFIAPLRDEITGAAKTAVCLLRWRCAAEAPHDPFRARPNPTEWSLDGSRWLPLPGDDPWLVSFDLRKEIAPEVRESLRELTLSRVQEPIAHSLLREAWNQRFENTRSALVIGVAALEIGVKDCVATLAPETRWLVDNLQSPPIWRILRRYLPLLKGKLTISEHVLPPPSATLRLLEQAIERRNKIAHVTGEPLAPYEVETILDAVRDVLYLLDYYCGQSWALQHVSIVVRDAMGVPR